MNPEFTIGTDPEMFASKGKRWVSAIPLIKGTKENPDPLPNGGTVSHDNVAVEFTIEPAQSKKEFVQNIGDALQDVKDFLPKEVSLNIVPSAVFGRRELKHKKAKQFGCSPDYNAYTRQKNIVPQGAEKRKLRTCGGHIHVGFVEGTENKVLQIPIGKAHLIKMMDLFHGIFSTVLDFSPEAVKRRTLYGKPGCYRDTDYGVEYRTLSNYWLKSPQLVKLIYHLTDDVLKLIREKKSLILLTDVDNEETQDIISKGDVSRALKLIRSKLLEHVSNETKVLFDICFFGVEDYDFEKEWELT
jgi:hypothetical protein